jgi:hypothetical protein
MRSHEIVLSCRFLHVVLLLSCGLVVPAFLCAQTCIPGTQHSIRYDTVISSSAGTAALIFPIPKISPAKTLLAVVAQSSVRIDEGATGSVIWVDTTSSVQPAPEDVFSGTSLWFTTGAGFADFTDQFDTLFDPVTHLPLIVNGGPVLPGQQESVPFSDPNFIALGYDSITSFPDLADFVGTDTDQVFYAAITSVTSLKPNQFTVGINGATAHISFTLYYCDPVVLAIDLLTFQAEPAADHRVLLSWSTAEEREGGRYQVEVSRDGVVFTSDATVAAGPAHLAATYSHTYIVPPSAGGRLYFRLKEIVPLEPDRYSAIKVVDIRSDAFPSALRVYPNPATDFVQLALPAAGRWQIDIYDVSGKRVQSGLVSSAAGVVRIDFGHPLIAGVYFIRAAESGGQHTYSTSFVVSSP